MATTCTDIAATRLRLLEDGFVVVPAVIQSESLGTLRDRVALFYRGWDRYPDPIRKEILPPGESGEDYAPVREINWPGPALRLLDTDPAVAVVRHLMDSLTGSSYRLVHVNSLLKPAVNGAPVLPHQDTAYNIQSLEQPLTVWIPFEETTAEDGTLFYLQGSHKLGEIEHDSLEGVRWVTQARLAAWDKPAWRDYSGQPGSIGIHDSRLIHGSHPNRSPRDRLALSLRFAVFSQSNRE